MEGIKKQAILTGKTRDSACGIRYQRSGDYYIPVLKLPEESRSIGHWGRLYRDYLKEHRPILYSELVLSCRLWTYLANLNEQAQNRLELIMEQMKAAEGVTEDLKANDQIAWIGAMNSIHSRAEEIILQELIYGEGAV